MSRALLFLESCLAIPIFIASWMICAIGFAAMAGFQMAKLSGADKRAMLDQTMKGSRR